jgi:hypothetical protein
MIWSTEEEMKNTLCAVENLAEALKRQQISNLMSSDADEDPVLPSPGSQKDIERHRGYVVDVSPTSPIMLLPRTNSRPLELFHVRDHVFECLDKHLSDHENDLKRRKIEIIEID